jgi:hypothetical protein
MNYPCPKCQAENEVDLSRLPDNGTAQNCSECQSKFWTIKEPFALRAYKKQGDIFCGDCGEKLEASIICQNCGALFPDYHIVQIVKPVPRKTAATSSLKLSGIKIRRVQAPPLKIAEPATPSAKTSHASNKPFLIKASMAFLAVLLVAFLGSVYQAKKLESAYSKDYIFALYGIKTGTDMSLKTCSEISERIRNPIPGQSGISQKEVARLNAAKAEIDQVLSRLQSVPDKYSNPHDRLLHLYASYEKLLSFTVSYEPQNAGDFTGSVTKLETDFLQKAQALKAGLPEGLSKKLKASVVKYKNLEFLI